MADDTKQPANPAPAPAPAAAPPAAPPALWFTGNTLNWADGVKVELRVDARQDWQPADQPRVLNGTISARVQGSDAVTRKNVVISIAEITEA